MKSMILAGGLLALASGASAATYDFKNEIDNGDLSEAILETFVTTPYFTGPGLSITAGGSDYVYLDYNNAGIGVCGAPDSVEDVGEIFDNNDGTNRCSDSGDDSIQGSETLIIEALTDLTIDRLYFNANHDGGLTGAMTFLLNSVETSLDGMASLSGSGDYYIDLGLALLSGETLTIGIGASTADSYLSGIGVTAVPVPAAGLLLLGGLGALGALRRRKS